jgi:predicted GNAT family N-acyltransferase
MAENLQENRIARPVAGVSRPIRLSDDQMLELMRVAQQIPVDRREAFLLAVAAELRGKDLGDGVVHRAIRVAAKQYFDPPIADSRTNHGKYA